MEMKKKNALDKAQEQFDEFDKQVKSLTLDEMNKAILREEEPQTKLSAQEIEDANVIRLKPTRSISSKEKFNEKFRQDYEFQKEQVKFIAEHNEVKGESIDLWTKPFPGMPAEEWIVPVNKIVYGPRYLAERIKACTYHRLVMQEHSTSQDHMGTYYGQMVAKETIARLTATPVVNQRKSFFMGA